MTRAAPDPGELAQLKHRRSRLFVASSTGQTFTLQVAKPSLRLLPAPQLLALAGCFLPPLYIAGKVADKALNSKTEALLASPRSHLRRARLLDSSAALRRAPVGAELRRTEADSRLEPKSTCWKQRLIIGGTNNLFLLFETSI